MHSFFLSFRFTLFTSSSFFMRAFAYHSQTFQLLFIFYVWYVTIHVGRFGARSMYWKLIGIAKNPIPFEQLTFNFSFSRTTFSRYCHLSFVVCQFRWVDKWIIDLSKNLYRGVSKFSLSHHLRKHGFFSPQIALDEHFCFSKNVIFTVWSNRQLISHLE